GGRRERSLRTSDGNPRRQVAARLEPAGRSAQAVRSRVMKLRHAFLLVVFFGLALPALAYIEALNSLKGVFQESDVIARGVIDAVSSEKKVVVLKVVKPLKGKCAYERIRINLGAAEGW